MEDQIPLKTGAKTGHYRLKSKDKFNKEIYSRRNNVESIFSVIKTIFKEQIEAEAYNYQTSKQNSKTQFTTFIDQPKFNKNKDFYKAIFKRKFNKNKLNVYYLSFIPIKKQRKC